MKSTRSNALHAVGYSYACKRAAAIERRVSDARHAVRYGYACKRTAAIERRVSDACYTVCNAYTCKRAASVKCTFSNARQVAVYYNVFQTFTIFKCLVLAIASCNNSGDIRMLSSLFALKSHCLSKLRSSSIVLHISAICSSGVFGSIMVSPHQLLLFRRKT